MKYRLKKLSLLAFSVSATTFIAATAQAEDTIKIGLAVPLTGDFAAYNEVGGAKCMAEKINQAGGVNGMQIELMIQDSGSDTQTALSLAEKFSSEGAVSIGTIPFSDTMIPVAQTIAANGTSLIQAQSTQIEMHTGIVDNFITNVAPDPYTATAAANHALSVGVKNVVLLKSDDGGSWSAKVPEWFGEVIEAGGGTVLSRLNYTSGTNDFSPQIAEMKSLETTPDAVFISWSMPDIGVLIRQLKAAGIDAWVIGADGFDDPSLDALAEDDPTMLEKVFFGTLAPSTEDSKIGTFIKECEELGIEVPGLFSALGGDMVKIVAFGVETAGSIDPTEVREAIRAADSIPVMSVDSISFKDTSSYALREIPVVGFSEGTRVILKQDIPDNVPEYE